MRALRWKMALRRKKSNLMTMLLISVAAAFLLLYPGMIEKAEAELDTAYETIEVSGWLLNANGYDDPKIPYRTYKAVLTSGFIERHYAYSYMDFSMPDEALQALAAEPENAGMNREELLKELASRLKNAALGNPGMLFGVSGADAEPTFQRLRSSVTWLEGYSAADLAGDEAVCILPREGGAALGEEAAFVLRQAKKGSASELRQIVRFKVIGVYDVNMSGAFASGAIAFCPLETMRNLLRVNPDWEFSIRSFSFVLQNNRELPRFKEILVGLRLNQGSFVRAALDDRILQGTVAPIERNIALLRGIETLLFALVTGMGFLICFLFTRGRKMEFAVMRMLGESPLSLMLGVLLEQAALCACGAGAGIAAALIMQGSNGTDWRIPALVAACYLSGAALAVLASAHGQPMTLLKGRE